MENRARVLIKVPKETHVNNFISKRKIKLQHFKIYESGIFKIMFGEMFPSLKAPIPCQMTSKEK